jgi:hypothetical protein
VEPDAAGHTVAKIQQNVSLKADNLVFQFNFPGTQGQGIALTFDRLRETASGPILWSVDEGKLLRTDTDITLDVAVRTVVPMPTPQGQAQPQQVQAFLTFQGKVAMAKI